MPAGVPARFGKTPTHQHVRTFRFHARRFMGALVLSTVCQQFWAAFWSWLTVCVRKACRFDMTSIAIQSTLAPNVRVQKDVHMPTGNGSSTQGRKISMTCFVPVHPPLHTCGASVVRVMQSIHLLSGSPWILWRARSTGNRHGFWNYQQWCFETVATIRYVSIVCFAWPVKETRAFQAPALHRASDCVQRRRAGPETLLLSLTEVARCEVRRMGQEPKPSDRAGQERWAPCNDFNKRKTPNTPLLSFFSLVFHWRFPGWFFIFH